ncbi:hypothetical protein BgiMline_011387, partial [Biomphalaria glabrata]
MNVTFVTRSKGRKLRREKYLCNLPAHISYTSGTVLYRFLLVRPSPTPRSRQSKYKFENGEGGGAQIMVFN